MCNKSLGLYIPSEHTAMTDKTLGMSGLILVINGCINHIVDFTKVRLKTMNLLYERNIKDQNVVLVFSHISILHIQFSILPKAFRGKLMQ